MALALVAITAAVVTKMQDDGSVGPQDEHLANAVMFQTFLGVAAVSALLTAALSHLHNQAATALQAAKHDLELRVNERTESLSRERARLAIALRTGLMGAYELKLRDGALWWSPGVYPLYGVDPATFSPTIETMLALVHHEDRQEVSQKIGASPHHGEIPDHEFRIVRPDGQVRWVHYRSHVGLGPDGLANRAIGVAADITERTEAEAALRKYAPGG